MKKVFDTYSEAYALYSEIVSGRDPDRKNASITHTYINGDRFYVWWEPKTL